MEQRIKFIMSNPDELFWYKMKFFIEINDSPNAYMFISRHSKHPIDLKIQAKKLIKKWNSEIISNEPPSNQQ